ncbi:MULTISPECIES: DUF4235 domain-containing protein [Kocuria]|uniref:DUF4235 domain-containing protein n=1 Tax=Kocuria varians TaxID=1272 RepID=A0A7D7KXE1_KOCVA|nr:MULTISPECIES: DUF4235 domain-containing protein [Kocuria]MDN5631002.1 DUF4235 domain-containing protein [Kocuria sp.]QMS55625.1 hypothetical protein CIB50_0000312 [Kocuria varians]RUP80699.1 DUF4235 domain-containing protein [Kocuria sp. HSID17590]RUQ07605.1 DUF4235 domain-containing protein [Kocuria sp. HSID17582]
MNKAMDILGTVASLGGVALANKGLSAVWKQVTGNEPPAKNPDEDEAWRDIILWAMITGVVGTVIKVGIARQVSKMESEKKDSGKTSQSEI